jgi:TMEM175 potassium channel family protein
MAMRESYNAIAGQSVERVAALSDGVSAIAMTLLVLDLHAPAKEAIHSESGLWQALGSMAPQITAYLMSFLTLGILLGEYRAVGWRALWQLALRRVRRPASRRTPPDVGKAVEKRILIAQALYGIGALLCLINTYVSIGFIVLVQLNYAIAPGFRARPHGSR